MISQFLALLLLVGTTGPGQAQTSSNQPAAVSQTIRGVTVQLTDLQWSPFDPPNSPVPFFKEFYLSYRVFDTRLSKPLPTQKSLLDYITAVAAVRPDGGLLPNPGSGMIRDRFGATVSRYSYWENVDPRWPLVAVDVDFVDPVAPPRASGRFAGPITITGVPVPSEFDKITPVHVEATTLLGTRILVEKVKVSPGAKDYQTTFVFRVVPASDAPDLQFTFSSGGKVADDTGARVNPTGVGIAGGGDLLEPQLPYQSQVRSVGVAGVPSAGAKMMTLTLDVNESSEQLKDDQWFRHFHLLVPMRLLDSSGRRPYSSLAVVKGKQVAATLESLTPQQSRYRTRFTLRDLTKSGLTWHLDAVRGKDEAGNKLIGKVPTGAEFFWKSDGAPLAKDENGVEVVLGAPGDPSGPYSVAVPKPAKTLAVEADVSAVRDQFHVLDFPKIPIPTPGQFRVLNRTVQDASGARLVLRKVGAYSPNAPLPGINFSDLSKPPYYLSAPTTGIVVVLAEPPDPKGRADFDFTVVAANDPFRRHLGREDGLTELSAHGDLLSTPSALPDTPARVQTFFFRAASLGAATFNLRMGHDSLIRLNRHESLEFPAVAAPAMK